MTVDLKVIREALAAQLNTVDAIRAYPYPVPNAVSNAAGKVAVLIDAADADYVIYEETFTEAGLAQVNLALYIEVTAQTPTAAQERLDELLSSGTGQDASIRNAIRADPTLGGVVALTRVLTADPPDFGEAANGVHAATARVAVEIHCTRS